MKADETKQLLVDVADIKKILKDHLELRKKKVDRWYSILSKPWFWFWAIVATVLILGGSLADLSWLGNVGGN